MGLNSSKNNKIKSHDLIEESSFKRPSSSARNNRNRQQQQQQQLLKSQQQHPEIEKPQTPLKNNEMILFRKSSSMNRSFMDDDNIEGEFLTDGVLPHNEPGTKQLESNVASSPTIAFSPITSASSTASHNINSTKAGPESHALNSTPLLADPHPNRNFMKVKSSSNLSTRQISFAYDAIPSEDTFLTEDIFQQREKSKFSVRFADKVLVMNSSDLDKFWYNRSQPIQIIQMDKIDTYFISLNDEKLTPKIPRLKKRNANEKTRRFVETKHGSEFKNEFEKLRSWNIIKESTFYEEERSITSIPSIG